MDYGHTTPPANSPEFPTPNNFEANDNLDLTNPETSWDQPVSIEHDKKALGSEALSSLEMPPSSEPKLGEITPYLPPGADPELFNQPSDDVASDTKIVEKSLNPSIESIKTTDRLSDDSVKIIDSSIDKFNQNNIDAADFYEEVRNAMETNIGNSYNRKLGGWWKLGW